MTRRSLRTTCTVSLIGLLIGCSTSDETNPSRGGGGDSSVADSDDPGEGTAGNASGNASGNTGGSGATPDISDIVSGSTGGYENAPALPAEHFDVVVYGATSGGVIAAVQASRMGKSVALIEPSQHLGGLTSGGLGATDWGNASTISGLSREFYVEINEYYQNDSAWTHETRDEYLNVTTAERSPLLGQKLMQFEPHAAEEVFESMLEEAGIEPFMGERLNLDEGVTKEGTTIVSIRMQSGKQFAAKMFIDTTYEGDLMAVAGVSYTVGREGKDAYGEEHAGYLPPSAAHAFSPQLKFDALPPGFTEKPDLAQGQGDHRVQAYNFRMCLTDVPENRVPWQAPDGYDKSQYKVLGMYLEKHCAKFEGQDNYEDRCAGPASLNTQPFIHVPMPNKKTDTNNRGPFSTDYIGGNYDYPDADYQTRDRITADHERYQKGLMYYLSSEDGTADGVPEIVTKATNKWGLCKDEFVDNGNWPHALYVREARRMVSDVVMTGHHAYLTETVDDSVGLASYTIDSHHVQRYLANGWTVAEGNFIAGGKGPYPISYRAIRPKANEITNLFVTFALSGSHVGFGSIRMEPVFMMTSQSAATAAAIAIDDGVIVQEVDYAKLSEQLRADGLQL